MAAPEIPKKQKAAVYDQPGTVSTKVVEIDVPEPAAGEVLINLYVHGQTGQHESPHGREMNYLTSETNGPEHTLVYATRTLVS